MRNLTGILIAAAVLFLLVTVVLPVLGFLLAVVAAVAAIAAGAYLAAPLLAKLPWFRDRIAVEEHGGVRTIRFGRTQFTSFRHREAPVRDRYQAGDVIDVEGRTVAEEEESSSEPDLLAPPEWRS